MEHSSSVGGAHPPPRVSLWWGHRNGGYRCLPRVHWTYINSKYSKIYMKGKYLNDMKSCKMQPTGCMVLLSSLPVPSGARWSWLRPCDVYFTNKTLHVYLCIIVSRCLFYIFIIHLHIEELIRCLGRYFNAFL